MVPLRVRERDVLEESPRLRRIVRSDGRLEVLTQRRRLPQLPPQPAEEAHRRLIGHGVTLSRYSSPSSGSCGVSSG